MNVAVILAGGKGTRAGGNKPKQFFKVAGKKIIEHTIDVFENNNNIDEIAIVSNNYYLDEIEKIVLDNKYLKVKKILSGGKERYNSSLAAIDAYDNDNINLLFHDAVRPLVNDRIINECVEALKNYDAVDVAINSSDTIIKVNEQNIINEIPLRKTLRSGQTPQCFKRGTIRLAYEKALLDSEFETTDDCGVVKKYLPSTKIVVVDGEIFNMKLTYIEDLFILDKLFQLKSIKSKDDILDFRVSKIISKKVMVVFGGSYGIGSEISILAKKQGCLVYSFSRTLNDVDVTNVDKVKESLSYVYKKEGHIDYVVCTAGLLTKESLYSMVYSEINKGVNVNFVGSVNVAKESYKYLKETKGSLLLFTSSSYTRGRMMYSIYSAMKAALVNFAQALSEEWNEDQIRINCINPERTKTPLRVKNFGKEPDNSLLSPKVVAIGSLNTIVSELTGQVIDIKRQ